MGEAITISCSQLSNHVLTHLYNNQDTHIPYRRDFKVKYNNSVFLSQHKQNGRTNYSPRALIYDVRNGFGALGKYEYYDLESKQTLLDGYEVINTGDRVSKAKYQMALDKGISQPGNLNANNTRYWTDYNKLVYRPISLNSLDSWELNTEGNVVNKFTPNMQFINFNVGQDQFKQNDDDYIDRFRKLLEESDYFQGIQLLSESDNSWSGFSSSYLSYVKDEFFNYTSNNKFNIWVWDFLKDGKLSYFEQLTRIKSMVEFSKDASVVFPLKPSTLIPMSIWEQSGLMSLVINSMWELMNSNVSNMKEIESKVLGDNFNRNIVNSINIKELKDIQMSKLSLYDMEQEDLKLGYNKTSKHTFHMLNIINEWDKNTISTPDSRNQTTFYSNNDLLDIKKVDSFPSHVLPYDKALFKFSIDSSIKYDLDSHIKLLSSSRPIDNIVGDKEELIQDLYNLRTSYSSGPEFDDDTDSFDD